MRSTNARRLSRPGERVGRREATRLGDERRHPERAAELVREQRDEAAIVVRRATTARRDRDLPHRDGAEAHREEDRRRRPLGLDGALVGDDRTRRPRRACAARAEAGRRARRAPRARRPRARSGCVWMKSRVVYLTCGGAALSVVSASQR